MLVDVRQTGRAVAAVTRRESRRLPQGPRLSARHLLRGDAADTREPGGAGGEHLRPAAREHARRPLRHAVSTGATGR